MKKPRVISYFSTQRQRYMTRRLGQGPTVPVPTLPVDMKVNDRTDLRLRNAASRLRRKKEDRIIGEIPEPAPTVSDVVGEEGVLARVRRWILKG